MSAKQLAIFSALFVLTGVFIMLIGTSIIDVPDENINAPLWVIRLCGIIFISAGLMMFLGEKSRFNHLFGALIIFGMAAIGFWVSFFGDANDFSGGIGLLSDSFNVTIARVLFGATALMCFVIGIFAMKKQLQKTKSDEPD